MFNSLTGRQSEQIAMEESIASSRSEETSALRTRTQEALKRTQGSLMSSDEDCFRAGGITIAGATIVVDGSFLKITSDSTGSSSSITIKADSGAHAKALFGVGSSVNGAEAVLITGTLKTASLLVKEIN